MWGVGFRSFGGSGQEFAGFRVAVSWVQGSSHQGAGFGEDLFLRFAFIRHSDLRVVLGRIHGPLPPASALGQGSGFRGQNDVLQDVVRDKASVPAQALGEGVVVGVESWGIWSLGQNAPAL